MYLYLYIYLLDKSGQLPVRINLINHIEVLVQEKRNSSALATELRLSSTNPSM